LTVALTLQNNSVLQLSTSKQWASRVFYCYASKVGLVLCCRARDKKKNIADEKAQAQRRLLRATKRHGAEKSEQQRQKEMLERRKEELVR